MEKDINQFFKELGNYYYHENDLSNITVSLCISNDSFKEVFLKFFFPSINLKEIINIQREVVDENGAGSRVYIMINMLSGEKYIIEVKINDRNHHFGQYEEAYKIPKEKFGYITNYYCSEGKSLGYDVKTWENFYEILCLKRDNNELDNLSLAYMDYLKIVCNIKKYNTKMNFEALKTIPQFFSTYEKIINEYSEKLNIELSNEKINGDWNYGYKYFYIYKTDERRDFIKAYLLLKYDDDFYLSIGITKKESQNLLEKISTSDKNKFYKYFKTPYVSKIWWNNLFFDLKEEWVKKIDSVKNENEQKQFLINFLEEVVETIRKYWH